MKLLPLIFFILLSCSHQEKHKKDTYLVSENILDNFELNKNYAGIPEIKLKEAPVSNLREKMKQDYPNAKYSYEPSLQVMTPAEFKQL